MELFWHAAVAQANGNQPDYHRGNPTFKLTTTQTNPSKRPAMNVLDRDFKIDLFSRKVVGRSLRDSLETRLSTEALRDAIQKRSPKRGKLLHHSDRGCHCMSDAYQRTLRNLGITCSMSRRGNCYDNAVAERFFWSLKHGWTKHYQHETLEDARLSVATYIANVLQSTRLHPTLGYKSSEQYEAERAPALAT